MKDEYVTNHKPEEKTVLQKRTEMGGYLSLLPPNQRTNTDRVAETILLPSLERHCRKSKFVKLLFYYYLFFFVSSPPMVTILTLYFDKCVVKE